MAIAENKKNKDTKTQLHGLYFEAIEVGMEATYTRTITNIDVQKFVEISGDNNPIHLNKEFAKKTIFKGKVVHGMLTASLISTVIGTKLPGPGCIYVNQNLDFKSPVKVGDTVVAFCKVIQKNDAKNIVKLETVCSVANRVVIEGQATILVPNRPVIVKK